MTNGINIKDIKAQARAMFTNFSEVMKKEVYDVEGKLLGKIWDTAGILEPKDLIEKKAIEKSSLILEEADLVILVLDGSKTLSKDDIFLINRLKKYLISAKVSCDNEKDVIIVINKSDLKQKINLKS